MNPSLRLVSANDSVELMSPYGAVYAEWTPVFSAYKNVYADSAMADERRLVYQREGSAIETITLHINAQCQDDAIDILRRIEKMLKEVRDYWIKPASKNLEPVYIRAKAANETNYRYAIILDGMIEEHASPFAQPFFGTGRSVIQEVVLIVERGQWSNLPPKQSEPVTLEYPTIPGRFDFLAFDGSGDTLDCNSHSVLQDIVDNGGFTFEAWIRCNDMTGTPGKYYIADHGASVNWSVYVDTSLGHMALCSRVFGTTSTASIGPSLGVVGLQQGQWTHIALVTTTPPQCYVMVPGPTQYMTMMWINGIYITNSSMGEDYNDSYTDDLRIGSSSSGTSVFNGDIKYVRISNGEVYSTACGIPGMPHPGGFATPSFCEPPDVNPNTIAQWNMSEGTGSTVDNATGNSSLDGNITGATWDDEIGCGSIGYENVGYYGYVAGCDSQTTITDIYVVDYSETPAYSSNLANSDPPYDLLPATFTGSDVLIIGNSAGDGGVFSSVVFNLEEREDDGDWSLGTPKYWNGVSWANLSGVSDGTGGFKNSGHNAISWELPSDWATVNLNSTFPAITLPSVTAYWVYFPVTVTSAPTDPPAQVDFGIYTPTRSGVTIPDGTSIGDISAVGKFVLEQRNGVYDSVLIGSKPTSSVDQFVQFIHTTNNTHNHSGITISGDGSDTANTTWPCGESRNGSGVGADSDTVTITLDGSIASSYAGIYRAFVVVELAYETTTYSLNLTYKINDVDVDIVNDTVNVPVGSTYAMPTAVDVGVVNISQDPDDISQIIFEITISGTEVGQNPAYKIYALALLPTDGEVFLDISSPSNISSGAPKSVGWDSSGDTEIRGGDVLIIDQVSAPASGITARVYGTSGGISGNYIVSTPSGVRVASGETNLWFMFYNKGGYGNTSTNTDSYCTGAHILNKFSYSIAQLYRLMRGAS